MIVKNEQKNIGRCLASLRDKVDEIVIIDTGSFDRTKWIINEQTPCATKVGDMPWTDDFSAARNESLRHATSDFILWIDADEELRELKAGAFRRVIEGLAADIDGLYLRVWCPSEANSTTPPLFADQFRLFRNHIGFRFEGRIHEQLVIDRERHIGDTGEVVIYHHGYIPDGDLLERKSERNLRILTKAIEEEPNNPAHHYYLGKHLAVDGKWAKAAEALHVAIDLWWELEQRDIGYAPGMFSTLAYCYIQMEMYQAALGVLGDTPEWLHSSELLYCAGMAALELGFHTDVEVHLKKAQEPAMLKATGMDPGTNTWRPLLGLVRLYALQGKRDKAEEAAREAQKIAPNEPQVLAVMNEFNQQRGTITFNGTSLAPPEREVFDLRFKQRLPFKIEMEMHPIPGVQAGVEVELSLSPEVQAIWDRLVAEKVA